MKRIFSALILSTALITGAQAVPHNDKIEGYWLYKDVSALLKRRGFERLGFNCLSADRGAIAVHCTSDFINEDGVRISVAVRKRVDVEDSAGRAYRVVCTMNCREFAWGQLLEGKNRRDPLE